MSVDLHDELLTLPNDEQLQGLLSGDKGATSGVSKVEVRHLAWLGANLPVPGNVVEIGSHRGKSTCCIASGIIHAGKATTTRLHCVDLWMKGTKTFAHYRSAETWQIFQDQVEAVAGPVGALVRPVMMGSVEAAKQRRRPIHLLFIDAGHKYPDVHADYKAWQGFIPVGGRIAFHDYGTRFPGVDKVVNEELMGTGDWKSVGVYGRIWTGQRVKGGPQE